VNQAMVEIRLKYISNTISRIMKQYNIDVFINITIGRFTTISELITRMLHGPP
jgi:hypothetical protein